MDRGGCDVNLDEERGMAANDKENLRRGRRLDGAKLRLLFSYPTPLFLEPYCIDSSPHSIISTVVRWYLFFSQDAHFDKQPSPVRVYAFLPSILPSLFPRSISISGMPGVTSCISLRSEVPPSSSAESGFQKKLKSNVEQRSY